MNSQSRNLQTAQTVILIATFAFSALAAGEIDPTFNPGLIHTVHAAGAANKTTVRRVLPLPDGKVVIAGNFRAVNKSWANWIARLNADGSVDTTFRAPEILPPSGSLVSTSILALALQADGKILIGGNFGIVGGESRPAIARLNSDGSLDTSFASADTYNLEGRVVDIEVGPDNKITFAGDFTYNIPPNQKLDFARVFANGSLDASFYPQSIITNQTQFTEILLLPGDKTLVAVANNPGINIHRLNATGTPELTLPMNGVVNRFAAQPDGKILVGGSFTTFNGFPVPAGIVRLNTNDSIDTSFTPPSFSGGVTDVEVLPGGKILLTGGMATASTKNLILLNSNGTADISFSYTGASLFTMDTGVQQDGKIIVGAQASEFDGPINPPLVRLTADGSLDGVQVVVGNNGRANDIFIQPDGRLLVAGFFNHADGGFRRNIARLSENGLFDASFTSNLFSNEMYVVDMQPNSTIVTGADNAYSKLDQAGTVEFSNGGFTYDLKPLPDGRVLVAINHMLRRVNSDNSTDSSFSVLTDAPIRRIIVQPDGKILIAGFFTQVNGTARSRIARLNANGAVDTSFNPGGGSNALITDFGLQPDGKIIIGGPFTGFNFDTNYRFLARLNANGTLDTTFAPNAQGETTRLKLQPDGKILVGGVGIINGVARNTVKRFNPDGMIDPSFDLGSGTDGPIRSIELQAGNKILIGGEFRTVNGIDRLGLARLLNDLALRPPFDYDGDGRADVSVFRPSENKWYVLRSSDSQVDQPIFGLAGDIPVPADYDGDGKTDVAIFRPSNGQWWYLSSIDGSQIANQFGETGDIPRPSDFDGDGKDDLILFRPSNSTWYRFGSTSGHVPSMTFGLSGDQPLIGDFDGDARADLAVFRPSSGDWWYAASSAGGQFRTVHWGQTGDIPVPADYDGDGKTDYGVYRPSEGGWYVYNSGNGSFTTLAFGTSGDRPVAADYDGDDRADIAVFRPSTGVWYLLRSTSGFAGVQFGISTDRPTPGAFVP